MSPHRFSLRTIRSASPTPPQGGSEVSRLNWKRPQGESVRSYANAYAVAECSPLLTAFLKRDALAGGFHDEVQGLGHAARQVPKPADEGQRDELFSGEVLLHGLEGRVVILGRQVRDFLRPIDGGLFFFVKETAVAPAVALQ